MRKMLSWRGFTPFYEISDRSQTDACHVGKLLLNRQIAAQKRTKTLPRRVDFARYLRDARIKRGLSVAEVAEQVGVSQASIYFWERDHCRPRDGNLTALCKALKLPIRTTRAMATA